MSGELKPCPFCGGEAGFHESHVRHWHVACLSCGIEHPFVSVREDDPRPSLVAAWNTRAAQAEAVEIVRELGEKLASLCFADMGKDEDEGVAWTTQEVWETIYRDRVQDWVSFEDLDAARATLARLTDYLAREGV